MLITYLVSNVFSIKINTSFTPITKTTNMNHMLNRGYNDDDSEGFQVEQSTEIVFPLTAAEIFWDNFNHDLYSDIHNASNLNVIFA